MINGLCNCDNCKYEKMILALTCKKTPCLNKTALYNEDLK